MEVGGGFEGDLGGEDFDVSELGIELVGVFEGSGLFLGFENDAFGPRCASEKPFFHDGDFAGCECFAGDFFGRGGHEFVFLLGETNAAQEFGVFGGLFVKGEFFVASEEKVVVGVELESAFAFVSMVTLKAVLFEDGADGLEVGIGPDSACADEEDEAAEDGGTRHWLAIERAFLCASIAGSVSWGAATLRIRRLKSMLPLG